MGSLISDGEIEGWQAEGWSFRIKNVKGKRYITRRKGSHEKSLGPFNEELWRLIETSNKTAGEDSSKSKKISEYMDLVNLLLNNIRSYEMSQRCSHIIDGYCFRWKYDEKPGFFEIVDANIGTGFYEKILSNKEPPFWVFKAATFYCQGCAAYK